MMEGCCHGISHRLLTVHHGKCRLYCEQLEGYHLQQLHIHRLRHSKTLWRRYYSWHTWCVSVQERLKCNEENRTDPSCAWGYVYP